MGSLSKTDNFYEKYKELLFSKDAIEIEKGWYNIVEGMLAAIQVYETANLGKSNLIPTVFNSIKATQGWLEIDYRGGDEVVTEIINFSYQLSVKSCEICGKPGKLYCTEKWLHWSDKKTLCSQHAAIMYCYTIK